jgi:hypothetical protein
MIIPELSHRYVQGLEKDGGRRGDGVGFDLRSTQKSKTDFVQFGIQHRRLARFTVNCKLLTSLFSRSHFRDQKQKLFQILLEIRDENEKLVFFHKVRLE